MYHELYGGGRRETAVVRQRRGRSMMELRKKATVHPVTIGRLEKARQPAQLETVRKLAGALEVEVEELLARR